MKLSKFSEEDLVSFDLKATTKNEVIKELVDLASGSPMVRDRDGPIARKQLFAWVDPQRG